MNVFFIVYRLKAQMRITENIRQKANRKKKVQNGHEWGETAVKLVYVAQIKSANICSH